MTPGFTISAVMLVLLLSFTVGHPMSLPPTACQVPVNDNLKPWLHIPPPCNLSGKNRSTAVCLRNWEDRYTLRPNVTVNYDEAVSAGDTASFLSRRVSDSVGSTGAARTHLCNWNNEINDDYAQMPSWRMNALLDAQSGAEVLTSDTRIECQCEAIVAPFNVLNFTCSGDSEKWTWITKSVIVGYTCARKG